MKCYHHPDRDAVAACMECGRGLCKECASYYTKPLCSECAVSKALHIKGNLEKACLLFAVLALLSLVVIAAAYAPGIPPARVLMSALFLACMPFGWYKLTEFTPRVFLILPVIGWIFYFIVKAAVSACIGPLALFFRVLRDGQFMRTVYEREMLRTGAAPFEKFDITAPWYGIFQKYGLTKPTLIIGAISSGIGLLCLEAEKLLPAIPSSPILAAIFLPFGIIFLLAGATMEKGWF